MGKPSRRLELSVQREEPQRPLEATARHYVARAPGAVTLAADSRV